MRSTKHYTPGYFPTPVGTCFIKPDLPFPNGEKPLGYNNHPFIVIAETEDSVECVMARTLVCERDGKDLSFKLRWPENIEISHPNPPMESEQTRRQYVNTCGITVIPKQILYEACDVRICSDGGSVLNKEDVLNLKKNAYEHSTDRDAVYNDPYDYENTDYPTTYFPDTQRAVTSDISCTAEADGKCAELAQ